MFKWMRDRQGRPIASILSVLMLVSLLMPLTPRPANAQVTGSGFETLGTGADDTALPRMVVVDFGNASGFSTGALGEEISNQLMFELATTKRYDIVKKSELVNIGTQMLNPPVPIPAVSVICAQVNANYGVNGNIESVVINENSEGSYAEVTTSFLLISRILGNPIAGGRIVQKSAPRKDYHGSNVDMVRQAVQLTAYNISNTILNTRFQVGTIQSSPSDGLVSINLGSVSGMRDGMRLTSLRFEKVTGRMEIISCDSFSSVARVLDGQNYGMAINDKVVPIFSLEQQGYGGGGGKGFMEMLSRNAGIAVAGVGLYLLINKGINSGSQANTANINAFPVADATKMPSGEIRINFPSANEKVVAYLLYRDTNPNAPIALLQPGLSWFEDKGGPLAEDPTKPMKSTSYQVTLNPTTGSAPVLTLSTNLTDPITMAGTANLDIQDTSFAITTRFVPMNPGDSASYFIRTLYYDVNTTAGASTGGANTYKLKLSNSSDYTQRCVMLAPPTLQSPTNGSVPLDGVYRANAVTGATSYQLQISTDSSFSNNRTILTRTGVRVTNYVQATVTQAELSAFFGANAGNLYWRFGARADGYATPQAIYNPNWNGYVYSDPFMHQLAAAPKVRNVAPNSLLNAGQIIPKGSSALGILRRNQ